ncbi:T9SS type A sorting domain-containing protein [Flavobacteriaceae bacterium]|nr:T9SS type A sorting domain-containing protein [Flavobacteriaceae bacterium]
MNLKFFHSLFLFLLCIQSSFAQIASYSFEGNLNDQVADQNGSFNPESCCDLFGADHCSKFTTKSGQSVCALPKVVGAGNFISESGNQSLHLDSFEYVKLPSNVNEQIDKDKSFSVDFKFKIPSESWANEIENENYHRTIFGNSDWNQIATGFTVNVVKGCENNENCPLELYIYAGGKENESSDVAGHWFKLQTISYDQWVNFSMILNFEEVSPNVIFNIDGQRTKYNFDIGGDIEIEPFKAALKANPFFIGTDKNLKTFYNLEENDRVGGAFLIDNLKIYAPKKAGDSQITKEIIQIFNEYISGERPLSSSEKKDYFVALLDNWTNDYDPIYSELKSYIANYESLYEPIFKSQTEVNINELPEETQLQYLLQQTLHDYYFTKENIKKDSFDPYIFEDSKIWPGTVSSIAPRQTVSIKLDGTYNTNDKFHLNGQTEVIRMTGYYAAPGEIITVTIPIENINSQLKVVIGSSEFDVEGREINRFARVTKKYTLNEVSTKIASPFGGPIYFRVPDKSNLGILSISLSNVVKMPFFSIKSGSETSLSEYQKDLADNYVKWVDWESDNFMTTITRPMANLVQNELNSPTTILLKWNETFKVFNEVAGRPSERIRAEYIRFDRMNPVGGTWSGASYPMFLYHNDPMDPLDAAKNSHVINVGFGGENVYKQGEYGYGGEHFIILHEMGHLYQMPTLPDETESNVNFPAAAIYNLVFNEPIDASLEYSIQQRLNREESVMDWFISPNFRSGKEMHYKDRSFNLGGLDWTGNELMYQSRGHAKYIEIAALFGWDAVGKINKYYYDLGLDTSVSPDIKAHYPERDPFMLQASKSAGINLLPLFHIWGMIPSSDIIEELSTLEYPQEIKNRILQYRSIVPRNKAAFVSYYNTMRAKNKNPGGNKIRWESMVSSGFGDYPEYNEQVANQIITQIDLILCKYYNINCQGENQNQPDPPVNDLDSDGVLNELDQCPDTQEGAVVNTNGCEILLLPTNNFSVAVTSSTCVGSENGSISISAQNKEYSYTATISGQSSIILNASNNFATSISSLGAGNYDVCFTIAGIDSYNQCFSVTVSEPVQLSTSAKIDLANRSVDLSLKGSTSYNILLNGAVIKTTASNLSLDLKPGMNYLSISTDLDCQGTYFEEIFVSEDVLAYPNPTDGMLQLYIGGSDDTVTLNVYDINSQNIISKSFEVSSSRVIEADISRFKTGIYFFVLDGKTIKIAHKIIKN